MAKIIAVIGSPGSGKTTVTLKLAQELYCATTSGAVIYLSPSLKVPALGVLFPNYTPDSIFSLGTMFDKTDIYEEDILNHLVTVKAMHSGNNEIAITRLEARVGSPLMSDVCRGLISINRGDVNTVYWKSLSMKFADIQRQQLRLEAEKIPRKVKKLSMCLLFCFMLIYIVVILAQIVSSMGVLFG